MDKLPDLPILIVDDEPHAVFSLTLTLKTSIGFKSIKGCHSSDEVMAFLEQEEPLLVLLDIGIPGITGDKLLSQIKAKYSQVPVIMVTADIEKDREKCIRDGAFDFISKPVKKERLIESVNKALEYRLIHS